jgi:uncharacterized protein
VRPRELAPVATGERPFVQAYRPGGFRVAGQVHMGALLLLPDRLLPWRPADPAAFVADDFLELRPLAGTTVTLLVLGLGARGGPLPAALRAEFGRWGMAVEATATPAACRTWNLVLAEERRAAAALVPLPPEPGG